MGLGQMARLMETLRAPWRAPGAGCGRFANTGWAGADLQHRQLTRRGPPVAGPPCRSLHCRWTRRPA